MTTTEILVCRNVPTSYTYLLPDDDHHYELGQHVRIPLGRSQAEGVILSKQDSTDTNLKLKPLLGPITTKPILSADILELIHWFSQYYQVSLFRAYQTVVGKMKLRDLEKEKPDESQPTDTPHVLSQEQEQAIDTIMTNDPLNYLLHGVTASGKTEIYMQVAAHMLEQKKGVIILIPEIALTPQMRRTFKARFGNQVVVVHSGLTPKQKEVAWNQLYQEKIKIVIGPRSAIFSPIPAIGAIIIDEEHETSYKQESNPRYQTHTVAKFRAKQHQAKLIFGSATPELSLYSEAQKTDNTVTYLSMKERVHKRPLPPVEIVDMRAQWHNGHFNILSQPLIREIKNNLDKREKTMILLNRRGYATTVSCQKCGTIHTCPKCQLSFTYHKDKRFRCHRCDYGEAITHTCRSCGKPGLSFAGTGTQKVEIELQKLFPESSIYRLDRDTASTAKQMEAVLDDFRNEGEILIGTQMIAKGHHFPDVTLVGVLGIDGTLSIPDFRSTERAFHLITQVSGRAGRGEKPGRVIVQTFQPEHYVFDCTRQHNYHQFYEQEIQNREGLWYPPFSILTNLIISSQNLAQAKDYSHLLAKHLKNNVHPAPNEILILGPKPAPIEFVRNHHRWHVLVKCGESHLDAFKNTLKEAPKPPSTVRFIIDFDPIQIL